VAVVQVPLKVGRAPSGHIWLFQMLSKGLGKALALLAARAPDSEPEALAKRRREGKGSGGGFPCPAGQSPG
jgi:hypothetical protein